MSTSTTKSTLDPAPVLASINSARPTYRDAHDAVAFALNCAMLEKGFKLVGLDDAGDEKKELEAAPTGWNASEEGYCFVYTHPKLPKPVVLKALRMEGTLIAHAAVKGDEGGKVHSLELNVEDYVNKDVKDAAKAYKDLSGLVALIDRGIRSQVLPVEAKPKTETKTETAKAEPKKPRDPEDDPLRDPRYPRRPPRSPLEDDDARDLGGLGGWRGPGGMFGGDLDPMGGGGGSLLGPHNFPGVGSPGVPMGRGGRGGRGGMAPRFDPFGPMPGIGRDPGFDDFLPPGPGGPRGFPGTGGGGSGIGGPRFL
jgi:proteasome inhibitor subunit 1 (PI31)